MRRRIRDGVAVIAFAALIWGSIASIWAFAVAVACIPVAAVIDPDSRRARARAYAREQRQQRNEYLLQRAMEARQRRPLYVPIQGHPLECGCVQIPGQLVRCPADAALAEIEDLAREEMQ